MTTFFIFVAGLLFGGVIGVIIMAICAMSKSSDNFIVFGEWIYDFDKRAYECSLCRKYSHYDYNCCPNCGAEMLRKSEIQ